MDLLMSMKTMVSDRKNNNIKTHLFRLSVFKGRAFDELPYNLKLKFILTHKNYR